MGRHEADTITVNLIPCQALDRLLRHPHLTLTPPTSQISNGRVRFITISTLDLTRLDPYPTYKLAPFSSHAETR